MTLFIAKNNLKNNFSMYIILMVSATIMLSLFIALVSFMSNPLILEKISESRRVEGMANVIFSFFVVILIFYIAYFNRFFLKRRSYEVGVLSILGFTKKKIFSILFFENSSIFLLSYFASLLFGNIVYLALAHGINYYLKLEIHSPFVFSFEAVSLGLFLVIVMLLLNSLVNYWIIRKHSLIHFVRYSKKQEKPLKSNLFLAILGVLFLCATYFLCLNAIRIEQSIWFQIGVNPVTLITGVMALLGTILVVRYSTIAFVNRKANRVSSVYTEFGNVYYPRLKFRISSKNKLLVVLSLLISFTVLLFGVMSLTFVFPFKSIERIVPSAIEYPWEEDRLSHEKLEKMKDHYNAEIQIVPRVTLETNKNIPIDEQNSVSINYFDIISQSDYIHLLEAQEKPVPSFQLESEEGILLNYYPTDKVKGMDFILEKEVPMKIKDTNSGNVFSFASSVTTLVVNDRQFEQLSKQYASKLDKIVTINGPHLRDNKNLYHEFDGMDLALQSSYQKKRDVIQANASTFIFITFIAIVFIVCSGSVLYFTNLTEQMDSKQDYDHLSKLGYSPKQLRNVLFKEIAILYGIPILCGVSNGIFATIAFRYLFLDQLVGFDALVGPITLSFLLFISCYYIIYVITKRSCRKLIFNI